MFALFLIANSFRVAMTKAQNETVNISLSIHLRSVCRESRSQPVARHKSVCLGLPASARFRFESVLGDIDTLVSTLFAEVLIEVKAVLMVQW